MANWPSGWCHPENLVDPHENTKAGAAHPVYGSFHLHPPRFGDWDNCAHLLTIFHCDGEIPIQHRDGRASSPNVRTDASNFFGTWSRLAATSFATSLNGNDRLADSLQALAYTGGADPVAQLDRATDFYSVGWGSTPSGVAMVSTRSERGVKITLGL